MQPLQLKIKPLQPDVKLPIYATAGAACFDIHAHMPDEEVELLPGCAVAIPTALSLEVPEGWSLDLYSRSGHGLKHGIRLSNGTGIIDADYRGELIVLLHCDPRAGNFNPLTIRHGDRIAQAKLVPAPRVEFVVAGELAETVRGSGGFGHTGQ